MRVKGLTIIELVLIVAIVASVAMIMGPIFESATSKTSLDSEAGKVVAHIRRIRNKAISEGREYTIHFIHGSDAMETYYLDRDGVQKEDISSRMLLDRSVDLVGTTFKDNRLSFNLLGEPGEGGTVNLTNTRRETAHIDVAAKTGKITFSIQE